MGRLPIWGPQTSPAPPPWTSRSRWSPISHGLMTRPKPPRCCSAASVDYRLASDEGGGVRHTVFATLTDRYGHPVSGVLVYFFSDADNGDETAGDPDVAGDGSGGAGDSTDPGGVSLCSDTGAGALDGVCDGGFSGGDNFAGSDKTNRKGVGPQVVHRDLPAAMTERLRAVAVIGRRDGAATGPDGPDADDLPGRGQRTQRHPR